jgi:hypothetical protein
MLMQGAVEGREHSMQQLHYPEAALVRQHVFWVRAGRQRLQAGTPWRMTAAVGAWLSDMAQHPSGYGYITAAWPAMQPLGG